MRSSKAVRIIGTLVADGVLTPARDALEADDDIFFVVGLLPDEKF
jgi:hypothetical protein